MSWRLATRTSVFSSSDRRGEADASIWSCAVEGEGERRGESAADRRGDCTHHVLAVQERHVVKQNHCSRRRVCALAFASGRENALAKGSEYAPWSSAPRG